VPTITSIKPQRIQKRVNIYLDGKFGFGIDLENFLKLKLKIEQELTESEIEGIVKTAEFQKVSDNLLRFATLRPRSEKEIHDWLRRKEVHESIHQKLFDRLNRLDLIDDKKFAVWWVEQRNAFKPKPKRILNIELKIKGIKKEIIDEAVNQNPVNEENIARELLEKRAYKWSKLPFREASQKMSEFLARKGFDWDIIRRVVNGLLNDSGN
jgi:regulatory protein